MNGDVVFDPAGPRARRRADRPRPVASSPSTPPRCPTKRSSTRPTPRATSRSSRRPSRAVSARPSASTTSPRATRPCCSASCSAVDDQDYFERGIELAIEQDGLLLRADRHLRPLRGRDRLRRRPGAREPLRVTSDGRRDTPPARRAARRRLVVPSRSRASGDFVTICRARPDAHVVAVRAVPAFASGC